MDISSRIVNTSSFSMKYAGVLLPSVLGAKNELGPTMSHHDDAFNDTDTPLTLARTSVEISKSLPAKDCARKRARSTDSSPDAHFASVKKARTFAVPTLTKYGTVTTNPSFQSIESQKAIHEYISDIPADPNAGFNHNPAKFIPFKESHSQNDGAMSSSVANSGLSTSEARMARFCTECGLKFSREKDKFCGECGFKRVPIT